MIQVMQNAFIWRILHVYSLVLIIFQYWPISLQQAYSRIFLAPEILSIMENREEGHQTFTYACIALLLKVKRDFFRFLSFKDQKDFAQCVATKLTPQRFHASQSFCWRCLQRAMFSFFYFTSLFTCILPDLVREVVDLGANFVQFASRVL